MNLLASLLPGVRALRAPLAAGSLWVLAAWLAIEPSVPASADASGLQRSLVRVGDLVGTVGVTGVIAFAVYLAGTLWIVMASTWFAALLRRVSRSVWAERDRDDADAGPSLPREHEELRNLLLPLAMLRTVTDIEKRRLKAKVQEAVASSHIAGSDDGQRRKIAQYVYWNVLLDDWQWLPLGIVGKHPQLYAEIDRHQAEAELRAALIGPVLALTVVIAVRLDGQLLWRVLVVLVGLALMTALPVAGMHSQRKANTMIAGGIASGLIESPSLDPERIKEKYGNGNAVPALHDPAGAGVDVA